MVELRAFGFFLVLITTYRDEKDLLHKNLLSHFLGDPVLYSNQFDVDRSLP